METNENVSQCEIKPRSKLNSTSYSLLTTHGCNEIVSVFVSTFLISYIYSISTNYLFNIGLFYTFNYLSMFVFYYLISHIIDKTNRVVCYRVAILVRALFILSVVFLGKNLAQVVILAGALHGFSEACYWCSFNLMKNELIPNHCIKQYSMLQTIIGKVIAFIVPIVLGKIIDAESFKLTAIIILVIAAIEMSFSFLIKSRRPANSGFDLKSFLKRTKQSEKHIKLFRIVFVASFLYGFISLVAPLNTMLVMITFNSNFSLGLLTGIFSGVSIILLICIKKFVKGANNKWFYILAGIVPVVSSLVLVFITNKITVIIFNFVLYLAQIVHTYFYDVYRNTLLKKLDMYDDIAEYQCCIECLMEAARVVGFLLMTLAGLLATIVGMNVLIVLVKVSFAVSILSYTGMNIAIWIMEKRFVKYDMIVE